jgi:hypothetical protein
VPCTAAYPRSTQADFDTHTPGDSTTACSYLGGRSCAPPRGRPSAPVTSKFGHRRHHGHVSYFSAVN